MTPPAVPLVILGAGPIGLEAALAASEAGLPFRLLEADTGGVGANIRRFAHVRLFSPWSMNVSARMRNALAAADRECPDGNDCPTGEEFLRSVLEPVASLTQVAPHLELDRQVVAVGRQGLLKHEAIADPGRGHHPLRILVRSCTGEERILLASTILDCTGWSESAPLGDGGIPARGEADLVPQIEHEIPNVARDASRWRGRTVLLVGSGHSAQTAARDFARLAADAPSTRVIWVLRRERSPIEVVADDPLPERARLGTSSRSLLAGSSPSIEARPGRVVEAVRRQGRHIVATLRRADGELERVEVDRVVGLTGRRGNQQLYRELQVHECFATAGPMQLAATLLGETGGDCLAQTSAGGEVLRNPEPGFFILGSKSYGRNNTFLLRVGYEQVAEVFSLLAETQRLRSIGV